MTKSLSKTLCLEATCPTNWDAAFAVHPRGSVVVKKRTLSGFTSEQWENARDLLEAGYVLGMCANPVEAADIASAVQSHTSVPVVAVFDEDTDVVYLCRDDAPTHPTRKLGKRRKR